MSNDQKPNDLTSETVTPVSTDNKGLEPNSDDYFDTDPAILAQEKSQDSSEGDKPIDLSKPPVDDEEVSTPTIDKKKDLPNKTGALNRWLGTPKIRFTALTICIGAIMLGGLGYALNTTLASPKQEIEKGKIGVPKTSVGPSAIVNSEQAAHIREQQMKAGDAAVQNGDTYLPSIVTVGDDSNKDELLAPTQPGLKNPVISNERKFTDKEGKVYTAEQAVSLLNSGIQVEGVTKGKGSIVDVNINSSFYSESLEKDRKAANSQTKNQNAEKVVTFEPHVVKPYSPSSSNTAQSELLVNQTTVLEKSTQDVDAWQDQYLAMRLKKANMVNQMTQVAFSEQVEALENTVKPPANSRSKNSGFTTSFYSLPAEKQTVIKEPVSIAESPSKSESKPVIYAGESYRAILKNQVNTDDGNEVVAVLQNGPLKGATLIGSVVKTNNNIQFSFTRLLRKGKSELTVAAVGRQLGSNSSGMADDINKHYFVRYSALVASSALSGVGKSYEQTSGVNATVTGTGTVVTNSTDPSNSRILGNAVGELGDEISDDIKDMTKKPITYITNNGKVFNVFFNQNVVETSAKTTTR